MSDTPTRDPRKCHAHSSRTGEPCQRWAMKGQRVCPTHGGRAPAAKRSARERLDALVEPAIEGLRTAIRSGNTRDIVTAAKAVLDRSGFPRASRLEIEQVQQQLSEHQAAAVVRVLSRALGSLGLPAESPAVRAALSAALMAESGADYTPPANVEPLPRELSEVIQRWWAGETTARRLASPGAVDSNVEGDDDILDAELIEL